MSVESLNILDIVSLTPDPLSMPVLNGKKISADVLRLDKIHPVISGNKWFKMKCYLQQAVERDNKTILTFGGPYSNHIIAVACATHMVGLSAIGIIRGELPGNLSHTLKEAQGYGMQLLFISRKDYSLKDEPAYQQELNNQFPGIMIIPEGGSGELGLKGITEMLNLFDPDPYTHVLCAIGTGTMYYGLAAGLSKDQLLIGISVLKGITEISSGLKDFIRMQPTAQHQIFHEYHFGGYAKKNTELIHFMNEFFHQTGIPTDIVYTAKLFYAVNDLIKKDYFPASSKLLIIHSGGLQGNQSLPPATLAF